MPSRVRAVLVTTAPSVNGLLVATGCVRVVPEPPLVCSPLSVVENSVGKKRLVINLRHLNRFLWKQKFTYEDLRIAMMLLREVITCFLLT